MVTLFGTIYLIGKWTDGNASLMLFAVAGWSLAAAAVTWVMAGILSLQRCDCPNCQDRRLRQLFRRPSISPSLQQPTSSASSARLRGPADRLSR